MAETVTNKHANRSAQTRKRFIQAAQKLYAERSIDSVSLNEITVAAGQKNRNALQYHFGNRDGLLQAIIDMHSERVSQLRQGYLEQAGDARWSAAEASARVLVMPIADYIEDNPEAVHYVKILSQMAVMSSQAIAPTGASKLSFRDQPELQQLTQEALGHLGPAEAQRRMFLLVSMTFHGIADICRASESAEVAAPLRQRGPMFEQLVCSIAVLLAAPARD